MEIFWQVILGISALAVVWMFCYMTWKLFR